MLMKMQLQWCHNERDGVSNHRRLYCLLKRLFRPRSKKTSKLRVTGLCEGYPPVTGGIAAQRVSNAENVSIWWRHHAKQMPFPSVTQVCPRVNLQGTAIFQSHGEMPDNCMLSCFLGISWGVNGVSCLSKGDTKAIFNHFPLKSSYCYSFTFELFTLKQCSFLNVTILFDKYHFRYTVRCRKMRLIVAKSSQLIPHGSPVRARYDCIWWI